MSLVPLVLDLAETLDPFAMVQMPYYRRGMSRSPWTMLNRLEDDLMNSRQMLEKMAPSSVIGKDGFQVSMDVAQFKPSELTVKVVDNNNIVVEGKHEEREDNHGYISRHFTRRYALPQGYDAEKIVSNLSSDGVLTVSVPKPAITDKSSNEKIIQIQQTGPAHLNVKENTQEDAGDKQKQQQQQHKK